MNSHRSWSKSDLLLPGCLIALAIVPVVAGVARLSELTPGEPITHQNARFFADPLPIFIHVIAASTFGVFGAFQFSPGLRRAGIRWHRAMGWLLAPSGLLTAFSGLWMTLFYPRADNDGSLIFWLRLVFGLISLGSIALSIMALGRRRYEEHGAWMLRGYAVAMGAGTQVFTHLPYFVFFGQPGEFTRALLLGAGWVINLLLVEWFLGRPRVQGSVLARSQN